MTAMRLVVAIALAACSHGVGEPPVGPMSGNRGSSSTAPSMPAIEVSCTEDTDCAFTNLQLTGDQTCCPVCGQLMPGRADWVRAVRDTCAARSDWTVRCAPLSCPVSVDRAVCKDQRCAMAQP